MEWKEFRRSTCILALFYLFFFGKNLFPETKEPVLTTQIWMKEGFSLRESMQLASEYQKGKEEFRKWIQKRQKKEQGKIYVILKKHNVLLYAKFIRENPRNNEQSKENRNHPKSPEAPPPEKDYFFIGGSYQNLDTRYLPKSEKNHSGFYLGIIKSFWKNGMKDFREVSVTSFPIFKCIWETDTNPYLIFILQKILIFILPLTKPVLLSPNPYSAPIF